jgi:hypothetical protein
MTPYRLVVPRTIVSLEGLLSFGLYTSMHIRAEDQNEAPMTSGLFRRNEVDSGLSLPVVSVLLGFLTAGEGILGVAMRLHPGSVSWRQA